MKRSGKKPSPAFMRPAARAAKEDTTVNEAILKQARKTGQLNLSNRSLEVVPSTVWRINIDPPTECAVAFAQEDRWWDQVELVKLILAANEIRELSEDIKLLQALNILDVHNNQISALPDTIGELEQLKRLVVSHNHLSSVPSSICKLENLLVLKVDNNKLTELPGDFSMLVHLEDVDVSHNELTSLPPSLCDCVCMHTLAVSNNKLQTLPDGLGSLPRLKQLLTNNNKLTTLPNFGKMSLEILNCNLNSLTELPLCEDGSSLKELHFGNNKLSKLDPQRLTRFTSVMIVDLRDNKISSIPESIMQLECLERLDLTSNALTSLPYVMGNMTSVKSLILDSNPFKSLRRDIIQRGTTEILKYLKSRIQADTSQEAAHHSTKFTPTKLNSHGHNMEPSKASVGDLECELSEENKNIDLSRRNLTELPERLFSAVRLTSLNIGFNKLTVIPPTIGVFTAITVLDIRNNCIKDLPQELEKCSRLRDIIISNNQFSILPPIIYSLKALETILANNNQISSIDVDGLLQLHMLSTLDLQNNNISQVPPSLGTVSTLRHLQLSGNPFRTPRIAVLSKGTEAVMEYLRGRMPA